MALVLLDYLLILVGFRRKGALFFCALLFKFPSGEHLFFEFLSLVFLDLIGSSLAGRLFLRALVVELDALLRGLVLPVEGVWEVRVVAELDGLLLLLPAFAPLRLDPSIVLFGQFLRLGRHGGAERLVLHHVLQVLLPESSVVLL